MTKRKKAEVVEGKLTVKASEALAEQIEKELEIKDPFKAKEFVDNDGFIQLTKENNVLTGATGCAIGLGVLDNRRFILRQENPPRKDGDE